MRNMLRTIFKLITRLTSIFLALLTIVATITVLVLLSIDHTILDPSKARQAFIKNRAYERLPAVTARESSLVRGMFAERCTGTPQACPIETMAMLNGLSTKQWETIISHVLPADELQTMTESTLDEAIGYFKGEAAFVQIPLDSLKAGLIGKRGEELAARLLESEPSCSMEHLSQLKLISMDPVGGPPIICSSDGEIQRQLSAELQRRLKLISLELPEAALLIKPPSPSTPPSLRNFLGRDLQSALQKLSAGLPYAPLVPLALLVLLSVFAVRSLRGWMRWWSIPVFIAGLITLICGATLFFMFDQIWVKYILHSLPPLFASGVGQVTEDVAHTLANDLTNRLMLQAGVLTLMALGILYASSFVKAPPDPSLPPLAQPGTPGGPVIHPSQEKKRKGW